MVPPRRPSAYLLTLLASPLAVLALIGWTRVELARVPPEAELGPVLDADALAALAVERLWTAFDVERGADTATLAGLRSWLDARGVTAGAPVEALHDGPLGATLERIFVRRVDRDASVELAFLRAPTSAPGDDEVVSLGAWSVTRQSWAGSGHVLLGRDLGCALCHVSVHPTSRAAPASARTVEPVRVGVLGDLVLRSDARVHIHGTLHLGGALLGADAEPVAAQACPQLRFAALGAGLRLEREATRPLDLEPLVSMDLVRLRASEGLLLGRYRGAPRVLRWELPERFPGFDDVRPAPPLDSSLDPGRAATRGLGGGRGGVVPRGALLAELDAGAPLTPTALVAGHLWAVGTSSEPLCIDGDVEVEGDLVIGGAVHGRGSLRARGMVVVVGSLRVEGQLALVAGTDLLAGAPFDAAGEPVRFVREAQRAPLELPTWLAPARLGRMGDRAEGPLVLEAYCYAPRHLIVVAPQRAASPTARGDVRVRGGLVAEVVAVHAPGAFVLEDDRDTRALLDLRAPQGLRLRSLELQAQPEGSREAAAWPIDWSPTDSPSVRPNPHPR